ncbi:RNA-binding S4 domain-containing protein [Nannocystis radixulma]|uniref:RNA-binding S4 domain-containing protein n=1 Tax=Nannocystis radixulma TaxID=2995305 RepID=A0ABT5B8M9_9BACT|nr:RNA-binding S4 domain-containing protein [Nannocystis radixulma]MDC0670479.1 RNA-binding S4 domain-containing protein [Nannocystis radixulma]
MHDADDDDDDEGEASPAPTGPAGDPALQSVRLDKWLWAARCFKTRGLASEACAAGHVKVGGVTAKSARSLRRGEEVTIKTGDGLRILEVLGLSERRGPAAVARTLYNDRSPPPPPKTDVPGIPTRDRGLGRPTKQERRDIRRLRGY